MKRRQLKKEERRQVYEKTQGHCAYCGCTITIQQMQVDHVVAISRGGPDTLDNMLPACRSCNHYKGTMRLEVFRKYVEKFPETLQKNSVTYRNAVRFGLVKAEPHKIKFFFEKEGGKK